MFLTKRAQFIDYNPIEERVQFEENWPTQRIGGKKEVLKYIWLREFYS